jgi:Protein of unknown function (DUF3455)
MGWLDGREPDGSALTAAPGDASGVEVSGYSLLGWADAAGEQHWIAEWSEPKGHWVWANEGPNALLMDPFTGAAVATHAGGRDWGGPIWSANEDGSTVQAVPDPGIEPPELPDRIPPLRLLSNGAYTSGIMGRVQVIQRIETHDGHPGPHPTQDQAGTKQVVSYSARYVFWGDLPDETEETEGESEAMV